MRSEYQIIVTTDAGNEGIDLQAAHVLVNYDIPWSLVRLEQRMGRIHRVGQTRVHLDTVEGLGSFVELEVVLQHGQSTEVGHGIARELMARLGIRQDDLVDCAYADLLAQKRNR